MRRVVELIKEVVDREPDPEAARARPRPIDRAWEKARKLLKTTLVKSLGFILHSTSNCQLRKASVDVLTANFIKVKFLRWFGSLASTKSNTNQLYVEYLESK